MPLARRPARHDRRRSDAGMAQERGFDLARLDAKTADLHLVVDPSQDLDLPRRQPAGEVARPVEAFSRHPGERMGHKALGRLLRPPGVAAGEPDPAQDELSCDSDGKRRQSAVDDGSADACHRPPDRDPPLATEAGDGGEDRGLGRPVAVEEPPPRRPARCQLRRAGLATDADCSQVAEPFHRQHREEGRGQHRRRHPLVAKPAGEHRGHPPLLLLGEAEARPVRQGEEDLEHRGVEAHGSDLEHPTLRRHPVESGGLSNQMDDPSVRHEHPVGRSSRARGIDEVGEVVRRRSRRGPTVEPSSRLWPSGVETERRDRTPLRPLRIADRAEQILPGHGRCPATPICSGPSLST